MKIINSSVRHIDINRQYGFLEDAKARAAFKQLSRKKERAQMKEAVRKEIALEHLDTLAEKVELARIERDRIYQDLMRKVTGPEKPQQRLRNALDNIKAGLRSKSTYPAMGFIPVDRAEFRVSNAAGEITVLASCAS